ncbi:hypothetical protein [Halorussus lipolyticus]|uniref:hypothetical protein n=1 Tax=Halorussus lipolyticus TaxID=3034024 RepID=UPI0023E89144|nr:hypothetical protein [Halorussus sp. DT80]
MTERQNWVKHLFVGLFTTVVVSLAVKLLFGDVPVWMPVMSFTLAVATAHVSDPDTQSLRRRLGDQRAETDAGRTMKTAAGIVSTAGLAGLVKEYGIGGVLYQLFESFIGAIDSAGLVFLAPFRAFGKGLGELVDAVVTSPIQIIAESADYTAFSITGGRYGFFGPATFAVGVLAVIAGLWVFTEAIRRMELSPLRLFRGLR